MKKKGGSVFSGGTAGFTIVDHELFSTKAESTVSMGGGITLFGAFFTLTIEYAYFYTDYSDSNSGGTFNIDLNHHMVAVGLGFKL